MSKEFTYKKRWGDRKDGRRLRSLEPMTVVIPFLMRTRNDASNLCAVEVELSEIDKFVHSKREEYPGINAMHVLIASYIRAISQKPGLNRFVSGQRIFARNDIQVIMEVKKKLDLNAPATMMKFKFAPDATIYDVYNQMNKMINDYKSADSKESGFDKVAGLFGKLPRFIFRFLVNVLYFLDYYGLLPKFLLWVSPFHGSLVITSMASLGIPSIYHHLYNFGNVPMFISFSATRHEYKLDRDGNSKREHYLDINFTLDERIADGQYYAAGLHEMKKYLKNPQLLETPPEKIVEDIE